VYTAGRPEKFTGRLERRPGVGYNTPVVLISGIAVVDLIASGLERPARPGELAFCSIRTSLGGHACNVSADLVRLGFPRSKLRAVFPAGRDLFGDFLVRRLGEQGVRAEPVLTDKAPTSLDLILVAWGEDRRYHATPGQHRDGWGPVLALLERYRPQVYYAGGVGLLGRFILPPGPAQGKSFGALTFVDVVSPYRKSWAYLRRALPSTDMFHCNGDEAAALTGERDPARAARAIHRLGAKNVFVTLGGEGTVAAAAGALLRVPAFAVRVRIRRGRRRFRGPSSGSRVTARRPSRRTRPTDVRLAHASACVCATGIGDGAVGGGGRRAHPETGRSPGLSSSSRARPARARRGPPAGR
jgi:hypothetical protein